MHFFLAREILLLFLEFFFGTFLQRANLNKIRKNKFRKYLISSGFDSETADIFENLNKILVCGLCEQKHTSKCLKNLYFLEILENCVQQIRRSKKRKALEIFLMSKYCFSKKKYLKRDEFSLTNSRYFWNFQQEKNSQTTQKDGRKVGAGIFKVPSKQQQIRLIFVTQVNSGNSHHLTLKIPIFFLVSPKRNKNQIEMLLS